MNPFPITPLPGGMNRAIARTHPAQRGCLWLAQGVIMDEVGRWRPCWEQPESVIRWPVLTDGGAGDGPPLRLTWWPSIGALVASSNHRAAGAFGTGGSTGLFCNLDTADVSDFTYVKQPQVWALPLGEWLLVCRDAQPARLIYRNLTTSTTAHFDDADYRPSLENAYAPIWLYREYLTDTCVTSVAGGSGVVAANCIETLTSFTVSGGVSGANGPHGSGLDMNATNHNWATTGFIWLLSGTRDMANLARQGFWLYDEDISADTLDVYGGDVVQRGSADLMNVRVGISQQQLMIRAPIIHNGRIIAVEGRAHHYSRLCGGTGVVATFTAGGSTCTIASATAKNYIRAGDEFIVFKSTGGTESDEHDYILSKANTTKLTVLSAIDTAGTVTVTFTGAHGMPSTTALWATRRSLSIEERSLVYFGGRSTDAANAVLGDERDYTSFETSNTDYIGEIGEGEFTAHYSQGTAGYLFSRTNAIYRVYGSLPLTAGIKPPDYQKVKIADVGVAGYDCICAGPNNQTLFFAGSDNRIYRLDGNALTHISAGVESVRDANNVKLWQPDGEVFQQVTFYDNRLYCRTSNNTSYGNQPIIWIYDTRAKPGFEWSFTSRRNSGQDTTGTLAARPVTSGSYAVNSLSGETSTTNAGICRVQLWEGDSAGGLFDQRDVLFVFYLSSGDWYGRRLNFPGDKHNYANLCHGVKVQLPYENFGSAATKKVDSVVLIDTNPMLTQSGGSAFNTLPFSLVPSTGPATTARNVSPKKSLTDYNKYVCYGGPGAGDTAISAQFGDGISALPGEIGEVEMFAILSEHKR